jgi:hypothetical protein
VKLLSLVCILLYVVVTTGVGVRMLLLARRTGGRPELLIGAGSVLVCGIGFPTSVASGFGKPAGEVSAAFWVVSELCTQAGIVAFYLFTQQVFRPGVRWAQALVAGMAVWLPVGLAGAAQALAAAAPEVGSVAAVHGWLLWCLAGYGGVFVWSALESLRQHGMARRRLALGLADPLVAHRFLLFALYSLAASVMLAANVVGVLLGHDISTSLVVLLPSGVLGVAAAAAMYLAFLPPGWYLARVRAAAAPWAGPASQSSDGIPKRSW